MMFYRLHHAQAALAKARLIRNNEWVVASRYVRSNECQLAFVGVWERRKNSLEHPSCLRKNGATGASPFNLESTECVVL